MKVVAAGVLGVVLVVWSQTTDQLRHASTVEVAAPIHHAAPVAAPALTPVELTKVVQQYCVVCHNDQMLTGNLSLQAFQVESPVARGETAEKMIVKLRAGMMPPPGAPRPSPDTLLQLVTTLEQTMDKAAAANPNPGTRVFQR
jgi:cytochrome c5